MPVLLVLTAITLWLICGYYAYKLIKHIDFRRGCDMTQYNDPVEHLFNTVAFGIFGPFALITICFGYLNHQLQGDFVK